MALLVLYDSMTMLFNKSTTVFYGLYPYIVITEVFDKQFKIKTSDNNVD